MYSRSADAPLSFLQAPPGPPPRANNVSAFKAVMNEASHAAAAGAAAAVAAAKTASHPLPPKPTPPPLPPSPTPPSNKTEFKDAVTAGIEASRNPKVVAALAAADALAAALHGDGLTALGAAADAGDAVVAFADALPSALGLGQQAAALEAKVRWWWGKGWAKRARRRNAHQATSFPQNLPPQAQSLSDAIKLTPLVAARAFVAKTRAAVAAGTASGGARAAETLDNALGFDKLTRELNRKVDATNAALAAADAKLAPNSTLALKLDAKHGRSVGVVVSLMLNGRFDLGVPTQPAARRRLQQATLMDADGWTMASAFAGGPDVAFDARLVAARAVRDAILALVAARLARAAASATRVAAVAIPIDAQRGLYDVRVGWRGGGDATVGVALAAVNDVPPGDPCAAWRADHDVCAALQAATPLDVTAVHARADTAPPGANVGRLALGRRWRGVGVPATLGAPAVSSLLYNDGRVTNFNTGTLKDVYWFIDKSFEGQLWGGGAAFEPVHTLW